MHAQSSSRFVHKTSFRVDFHEHPVPQAKDSFVGLGTGIGIPVYRTGRTQYRYLPDTDPGNCGFRYCTPTGFGVVTSAQMHRRRSPMHRRNRISIPIPAGYRHPIRTGIPTPTGPRKSDRYPTLQITQGEKGGGESLGRNRQPGVRCDMS